MESTTGELAVVERDGSVALFACGAEGRWTPSRLAEGGRWPTISPRGDLVALATVGITPRGPASALEIVPRPGSGLQATEAYRSPPGGPALIAPRVPNYASWSPDGSLIAVVGQAEGGLALMVSASDGLFAADRLLTGAPIFFAWAPDSGSLCAHTSDEVVLIDVRSRERRVLATPGGGFRTPAFTQDGRHVVFARAAPPATAVVARELGASEVEHVVARFQGGVALAPVGRGRTVSMAVTLHPDVGTFDELWLADTGAAGDPKLIVRGPFAAVFWSPDGSRVALMVPLQTGDGRYAITVRDRGGEFLAATEPFIPSQDYRTVLGFFDQYGTSHPLWSADSTMFAVCGRLTGDGPAAPFSDGPLDSLMAWRAKRGEPMVRVAGADAGFFAPPPPAML